MENQTLIQTETAAENSDMRQIVLLLEKLNKEQQKQNSQMKRQLMMARITALILAAAVAVLIFTVIAVLPKVIDLSDQASHTLIKADSVLTDLEKTSRELSEVDIEAIASDIAQVVENSGALVADTQKGLAEALSQSQSALQKIQSIDIDTLNRSIADLQAVISPLRNLFGSR